VSAGDQALKVVHLDWLEAQKAIAGELFGIAPANASSRSVSAAGD
jgi:hypothetical protein